jgi:hypothetical protein
MSSDSLDPNSNNCLRQFTDGRSCRMPRKKGHATLCIYHAREEQQHLESEKLAAEFASLSGKLNTVTDINHVLGKVFTALAEKRISQQAAATFGYLGSSSFKPSPASKANSTRPSSTPALTTPCFATPSRFLASSASNRPVAGAR